MKGAVKTVVRWWLDKQVLAIITEPNNLIIVTVWGKLRSSTKDSDVCGYVKLLLAKLDGPKMSVDNPGRMIMDAQT